MASWCVVCCTEHAPQARCPGALAATGPETTAAKLTAETERGMQGYGVLVAPAGRRWRSRILTFPNVLWTVPGGQAALKFVGRSRAEAERKAVDFIRRHCLDRGFVLRDEILPVASAERPPDPTVGACGRPPRYFRQLPVRFGRERPTLPALTRDLSEGGLFVATDYPLLPGELVGLLLELEHCKVPLRASVAWHRAAAEPGGPPGMGLCLVTPPSVYVRYVQALGS
jgi:hypothetical protein